MVQIQPTTDKALRKRESHTRKCVDGSDPTSKQGAATQNRDCVSRENLNVDQHAGSKQSTNFPLVGFLIGVLSVFRLNLNHPHTSVCGDSPGLGGSLL